METDAVAERIFGYTLVSDWVAKDASGDPVGHVRRACRSRSARAWSRSTSSIPQAMFLQAKVDGEELAKGNLNGVGAEPVRR